MIGYSMTLLLAFYLLDVGSELYISQRDIPGVNKGCHSL